MEVKVELDGWDVFILEFSELMEASSLSRMRCRWSKCGGSHTGPNGKGREYLALVLLRQKEILNSYFLCLGEL